MPTFNKENSEYASELAKRSQRAWEANGKKPRGFAARPELAREASRKAHETVRQNRIASKKSKD